MTLALPARLLRVLGMNEGDILSTELAQAFTLSLCLSFFQTWKASPHCPGYPTFHNYPRHTDTPLCPQDATQEAHPRLGRTLILASLWSAPRSLRSWHFTGLLLQRCLGVRETVTTKLCQPLGGHPNLESVEDAAGMPWGVQTYLTSPTKPLPLKPLKIFRPKKDIPEISGRAVSRAGETCPDRLYYVSGLLQNAQCCG